MVEEGKLILNGSSKDIYLWEDNRDLDKPNLLRFKFTDHKSVFDYGRLPDEIPNSGLANATMCRFTFNYFKNALGIKTTYVETGTPRDSVIVEEVQIVNPDEDDFSKHSRSVLIPIEVITRNIVTETSSAKRRLGNGSLHPKQLRLRQMPVAYPVFLPIAFVEGSTKLRESDEYLSWEELSDLCGLPIKVFNEIDFMARNVNYFSIEHGGKVGVLIFDHKEEFALDRYGNVSIADVALGLDEFTGLYVDEKFSDISAYKGKLNIFCPSRNHNPTAYVNITKQMIRDHYKAAEPEWCKALEEAKEKKVGKGNYPVPDSMPKELVDIISEVFKGVANTWVGYDVLSAVKLSESTLEYKRWAAGFYSLV